MKRKNKQRVVAEWKKKEVEEIKKLAQKFSTIAVVNLERLPTKQLQSIRRKLKGKAELGITKKILIKRALEACSPNTQKLAAHLKGTPALLFSNIEPFELFKTLKASRIPAAAKPGQIVPSDIWVPAGPTPFAPGPVISELSSLGIKSGVEGGKIAIKEDALVVKKGDKVSPLAASILARLGVEPMEIGINLVAALEGQDIYTPDNLDIDINAYISNIMQAHRDTLTLALELGIMNSDTASHLISKAFREARTLAIELGILEPDTVNEILIKTEAQAMALKEQIER